MVAVGTIYRGSKKAAQDQAGKTVLCLDHFAPTKLEAIDYSFGDDFGGVIDWKVETECCGTDNYRDQGCDYCGDMLPLAKLGDCLYCAKCLAAEELK